MGEFCEQTFGDLPAQIAFDWNTPRQTTDDAVPPRWRAFKQKELQKLFDYMDDLVDREYAAGSKRWLPALRDSIAFKLCYAYVDPETLAWRSWASPMARAPPHGEMATGALRRRQRRRARY